jgi:Flp pilus assembly protein CpaB
VGLSRLGQLLGVWPRRLIALACLLLAGLSALHADRPAARADASTIEVVVAAHDLSAGTVLGTDDVRAVSWPATLRPATAVANTKTAVGRTVAGPVGSGEVITSSRLVSTDLAAGLPTGLIAVAVPLVDSGTAALIHAGDRVDLLSPPSDTTPLTLSGSSAPTAQPATMVAANVLVLAVVPRDPGLTGSNAQLVVAVDQPAELRIAGAITSPMLATLIKAP